MIRPEGVRSCHAVGACKIADQALSNMTNEERSPAWIIVYTEPH